MASRSYVVELPEDITPDQGLEFVRSKAGELGIRVEGDAVSGTFEGMAEGEYRVETGSLTLAIQKKPSFVPWSMIESGLRRVFGEVRTGESGPG